MNVAKLTEKYIAAHPSLRDCLVLGLLNYSSVSRYIINDLGLGEHVHIDAVIIALRRHKTRFQKTKNHEKLIMNLLQQSRLEVKNKIVVAIIAKNLYHDYLLQLGKKVKKHAQHIHIIEGADAATIVTDELFLPDIEKLFGNEIIEIRKNLVQITLHSPISIEQISGVYAYLSSLFALNGVNIIETMSCWTDTLFVISEKDIGLVMHFLNF